MHTCKEVRFVAIMSEKSLENDPASSVDGHLRCAAVSLVLGVMLILVLNRVAMFSCRNLVENQTDSLPNGRGDEVWEIIFRI